ncbi:MAG: hypothetical protein Unbinned4466contig1000_43 [Prokaryotic dsDNA virus sp.]|nr:MAG: hypothetical protein Unbinned4466contig1000_43 [Prokaryotic dsDNA virus sp.]|tara:strand:+ start:11215 stop:11862 length:648 start_codon:yes stop_codon:yes gene_type:complete
MSRDCVDALWKAQIKPATIKLTLMAICDRADNDGYRCYPSIERVCKDTSLNKKTAQANIKKLIDMGLIIDTGKRVGASQRVKVLQVNLGLIRNWDDPKNGKIDDPKNGLIDVPENGMQNQSMNQPINQSDIGGEKPKSKPFKKPTVDEVRKYCLERGNRIDPDRFVDYYESIGWMINKSKMKDWKASVRTWERNDKNKQPSATPKQNGFDTGFEQ